uniref:CDT1-like protein b n=1 Tax=Anthurium amnicola TaxID=1678845 RepID=A0A1D1Z936_9ARAE
MEHEKCKEVKQTSHQFRCEKITQAGKSGGGPVADVQSMKVDERQDCVFSLASPTPEKMIQPPRSRKSKEHNHHFRREAENSLMLLPETCDNNELTIETDENSECTGVSDATNFQQSPHFSIQASKEKMSQLSEKHKIIAELFDKMVVSVRLLGLRKRLACFQNVSTQVEILAKRKFTLNHLAQMKYLFPEVVHIDKILIHDQISLCMKPDIRISLMFDAAKNLHDSRQISYVDLCRAFHARLLNFVDMHPEGTEIPEAPLPDSFRLGNLATSSDQLPVGLSMEQLQLVSINDNPSLGASHLSPFFSGHLSRKFLNPEKQMTDSCDSSMYTISMDAIGESNGVIKIASKNDCSHSLSDDKSPTDVIFSPNRDAYSHLHQTPLKIMSTPIKSMTETPVLMTPKRPTVSPDVKLVSQTVMLNHSARRSLIYSPSKSYRNDSDSVADITDSQDGDTKSSLSDNEPSGYHATDLQMVPENATDNHDLNQRGFSKRQQILASLPDLCNTISFIFGSINCTSITKQELVHKIISYNCDIEDTGEVDEQLHLLEELVPDWICGRTMSSGDFLYSISGASDLKAVRARLIETV